MVCTVSTAAVWKGDIGSQGEEELRVNVEFPRVADVYRKVGGGAVESISFRVRVPSDAPEDIKAAAYVKSKDGLWYQSATTSPFTPGRWNKVTFDLSPEGQVLL